jgi:hypothetical protein
MTQAYNLGSWLRDNYITNTKLLTVDFRAEDVSVYSTSVDRTLMTAQCVLMGLYPNGTSKAAWNDMTNRYGLPTGAQPIPIRTADKWDYIFQAVDICPEYDMRLPALYESAEWKAKTIELQPFMDWFKKATGFSWATLPEFYNFYDPVMVSKVHNKLDGIKEVRDRFPEIQAVANWVEYKKKSVGGKLIAAPLLGSIYAETEKMMMFGSGKRKFVEYSAHDSTLMALAVTAGFDSDPKFRDIASYTSAYVFELYNDTSKTGPAAFSVTARFREGLSGTVSDIATYTWEQWLTFITAHTFPNTASWCLACNNTGVGGGFPGAGPCYRELEYFNETTWNPEPDWNPPATDPPTVPASDAPSNAPPTNAGETKQPTSPPSNPAPTSTSLPPSAPPTPAGDSKILEAKLAATNVQLEEAMASLGSRDMLIIVLAVVLAICALIALLLGLKLRQAKSTSLAGIERYQGLNSQGVN